MGIGAGIKTWLTRAIRREDGNASIEFVILFPAMMTLFFSSFEISVLLLKTVMLERSLDTTVRELRLGVIEPATADQLRTQICDRTPIINDCEDTMMIELQVVSTDSWNLPSGNFICTEKDAEITPAITVNFGVTNDIMMVRVCAKVDPFFAPSEWIMDLVPTDDKGQVAVVAMSSFVNEP